MAYFTLDSATDGILGTSVLGPAPPVRPISEPGGDDIKRWDFKMKPELPNSKMDELYWESPHKQIFESFRAKVIKVHDGDTITVRWSERTFDFPVRFLDIDAPELNAPRGHEVRDWLANQIEGEEVDIIMNRKLRTEKWGRLLGKIMHCGMDMGDTMMRLGMVWPFARRREGELPNINKELRIERWL